VRHPVALRVTLFFILSSVSKHQAAEEGTAKLASSSSCDVVRQVVPEALERQHQAQAGEKLFSAKKKTTTMNPEFP
jgi:hypothetical protein